MWLAPLLSWPWSYHWYWSMGGSGQQHHDEGFRSSVAAQVGLRDGDENCALINRARLKIKEV